MTPEKDYQNVEKKRGEASYHPCVIAIFRNKPCNLSRHFERGTLLREIVNKSDLWASNDPERFIWAAKWNMFRDNYSQSAIDRTLRVAERMEILVPTHRVRNGRVRRGWIVMDHATQSEIKDGMCWLNARLNSKEVSRKRGQKRWVAAKGVQPTPVPRDTGKQEMERPHTEKSDAVTEQNALLQHMPEQCHNNASKNADEIGPNCGPNVDSSPLPSPFPEAKSPFQSPLVSPFQSPFPTGSESISEAGNEKKTGELQDSANRKNALSTVSTVNTVNTELNTVKADQPTPALPFSESDAPRVDSPVARAAKENLTIGQVVNRTVASISGGVFDEKFLDRYDHQDLLEKVIDQVIDEHGSERYEGAQSHVRLMSQVMGILKKQHDVDAPRGWYPSIKALRSNPAIVDPDYLILPNWDSQEEETSPEMQELYDLLCPPHFPYFYKEHKFITDKEYETIIHLSMADHRTYPEFYHMNRGAGAGRGRELSASVQAVI